MLPPRSYLRRRAQRLLVLRRIQAKGQETIEESFSSTSSESTSSTSSQSSLKKFSSVEILLTPKPSSSPSDIQCICFNCWGPRGAENSKSWKSLNQSEITKTDRTALSSEGSSEGEENKENLQSELKTLQEESLRLNRIIERLLVGLDR
ncbi:hypothetical protein GCK72_006667 [Caenorhabditis remanei]|uniref:Uncharacterized protein n=1 Tax=Caenorhabditis remanei TaxID=31234 RepID=A0A6A5HH93_CAERE|nr:hypothetical protein GCK72_006667 [Caenorhabditis remanei]KAF1766709.1 hypothetical protein GCK72_006667 [Caenorhabditis remanei]